MYLLGVQSLDFFQPEISTTTPWKTTPIVNHMICFMELDFEG